MIRDRAGAFQIRRDARDASGWNAMKRSVTGLRGSRRRRDGGHAGGDERARPLFGHAEDRLAVLTLHQLPADLVRDGKDLAAAKVRADELDGHRRLSRMIIGNHWEGLE